MFAIGLIPGAFGSLVAAAVASQQQQQQQQQNQVQQSTNQMLSPSSLSSTVSAMSYTPTSNVASTANVNPLMSGLTNYGACKLQLSCLWSAAIKAIDLMDLMQSVDFTDVMEVGMCRIRIALSGIRYNIDIRHYPVSG